MATRTKKPHRRSLEEPPEKLELKLRTHLRMWDDRSKLRTVSDGHFGHRAAIEIDLAKMQVKLDNTSLVRQFKKTPKKGFIRDAALMGRLRRMGNELAQTHFDFYTSNVGLMAHTAPYDYRLLVCNAAADIPAVDKRYTITDPECSRFVATICWIKLTALFNALYGEPLERDYINFLDRNMLKVRLRRVATYAELNFAYDYSNVLNFIYPVEDPGKWESYPRSWGELTFCCLWRRQQSKFFNLLSKPVKYTRDGIEHEFTPTYYI